jgi:hypothetical protein
MDQELYTSTKDPGGVSRMVSLSIPSEEYQSDVLDDDLEIFLSRFPPSSTSSATFHLTPPHAHAHFSMLESPSKPTAASALKDKTKSPVKSKSTKSKSSDAGYKLRDFAAGEVKPAGKTGRELGAPVSTSNGDDVEAEAKGHHFPQASHSGNHKREDVPKGRQELNEQDKKDVQGGQDESKGEDKKQNGGEKKEKKGGGLEVPGGGWKFRKDWAPSIRSAKSHKSKWGDDDAEPLWEVKKREWLEVSIFIAKVRMEAEFIVPERQW